MSDVKNNLIAYELKVPIHIGEMVIDKIHFRQPKLKHFKKLDGLGENGVFAKMIEVLCNLDEDVVDEIDPKDFEGIGVIIKNFTDKFQKT